MEFDIELIQKMQKKDIYYNYNIKRSIIEKAEKDRG